MEFYRYKSVEYASLGNDGDYNIPTIPCPKIEIEIYNLWSETPKGYWIGHGLPNLLHGYKIWISKTSKKRYAYPTKKEALDNFIKRNEKRIKILNHQLMISEINVAKAIKIMEKI